MTNWDHRFIQLAKHIANWSKDPSTKVGAVIVDPQRHIVSTGYNGFPRNVLDTDERLNDRAVKYKLVVHAEKNALIHAQRDLTGCTLYTWPLPPCSQCAAALIQAGITRVVAPCIRKEHLERWGEDLRLAKQMYDEAGIIQEIEL